jgi:hypothetical protein
VGLLSVVPAEARLEGLQPTAGTFALEEGALHFVPRFPFAAGTTYAVVAGHRRWTIERPAPAGTRTEVVAIYPTAATIPVNLLKLYVLFSAPMSEGFARRAVTLHNADEAFLQMDPELWDPHRTRLTMLLDPGRIKRGLRPHEEAGYPLQEGAEIAAEVAPSFRDAAGRQLVSGAERRYLVGGAVRLRVDPAAWRVDAPKAATRDPLAVHFDRPLDRSLLEHCIRIDGVAGKATIGLEERSWTFTPDEPWATGDQAVQVDPRLEDLAGNSVTRVFDRDLTSPGDDPLPAAATLLGFRTR